MAVDLNYEKDSKERIPYEHYLEVYQNADPKEISSRCDVPYDAEKQEFTVSLMGVSYRISWPEYNVFHIGDGPFGMKISSFSSFCFVSSFISLS